jgi:hypothetical protein
MDPRAGLCAVQNKIVRCPAENSSPNRCIPASSLVVMLTEVFRLPSSPEEGYNFLSGDDIFAYLLASKSNWRNVTDKEFLKNYKVHIQLNSM